MNNKYSEQVYDSLMHPIFQKICKDIFNGAYNQPKNTCSLCNRFLVEHEEEFCSSCITLNMRLGNVRSR